MSKFITILPVNVFLALFAIMGLFVACTDPLGLAASDTYNKTKAENPPTTPSLAVVKNSSELIDALGNSQVDTIKLDGAYNYSSPLDGPMVISDGQTKNLYIPGGKTLIAPGINIQGELIVVADFAEGTSSPATLSITGPGNRQVYGTLTLTFRTKLLVPGDKIKGIPGAEIHIHPEAEIVFSASDEAYFYDDTTPISSPRGLSFRWDKDTTQWLKDAPYGSALAIYLESTDTSLSSLLVTGDDVWPGDHIWIRGSKTIELGGDISGKSLKLALGADLTITAGSPKELTLSDTDITLASAKLIIAPNVTFRSAGPAHWSIDPDSELKFQAGSTVYASIAGTTPLVGSAATAVISGGDVSITAQKITLTGDTKLNKVLDLAGLPAGIAINGKLTVTSALEVSSVELINNSTLTLDNESASADFTFKNTSLKVVRGGTLKLENFGNAKLRLSGGSIIETSTGGIFDGDTGNLQFDDTASALIINAASTVTGGSLSVLNLTQGRIKIAQKGFSFSSDAKATVADDKTLTLDRKTVIDGELIVSGALVVGEDLTINGKVIVQSGRNFKPSIAVTGSPSEGTVFFDVKDGVSVEISKDGFLAVNHYNSDSTYYDYGAPGSSPLNGISGDIILAKLGRSSSIKINGGTLVNGIVPNWSMTGNGAAFYIYGKENTKLWRIRSGRENITSDWSSPNAKDGIIWVKGITGYPPALSGTDDPLVFLQGGYIKVTTPFLAPMFNLTDGTAYVTTDWSTLLNELWGILKLDDAGSAIYKLNGANATPIYPADSITPSSE
jgi:hypothetical protein